jgi:acetoin utilization deacetylase AcuC-like enzyme
LGRESRFSDQSQSLQEISESDIGKGEDPLSSLEYSVSGYRSVAKLIRKHFSDMPILMGGAGGYLPDTRTPEVWAGFAAEIERIK